MSSDGLMRMLNQSPPIRRTRMGELYELSPDQRRQCADLARSECCNYKDGHCLLLESMEQDDNCPCVQAISSHIECRWFQNAVLPIKWKLEAEIYKDDRYASCTRCGALYRPTRRGMKYCPDCAVTVRKIKSREYVAEHRRRKQNNKGSM